MDVPKSLVVNTDSGMPTAVVSWQQPSATENSGEPVTIFSNFNSGDTFPIGVTTVTFTATDTSGNANSARFTITVTGKMFLEQRYSFKSFITKFALLSL